VLETAGWFSFIDGVGVFAYTHNPHTTPTPACFFLQKTGDGKKDKWFCPQSKRQEVIFNSHNWNVVG